MKEKIQTIYLEVSEYAKTFDVIWILTLKMRRSDYRGCTVQP